MEIPAVHPTRQCYVAGVLTEEPPYQPPRWRCDGCQREQAVPDYAYRAEYRDETERPQRAVGWINCWQIPVESGCRPDREWHFCSLACVAGYQGWTDARSD